MWNVLYLILIVFANNKATMVLDLYFQRHSVQGLEIWSKTNSLYQTYQNDVSGFPLDDFIRQSTYRISAIPEDDRAICCNRKDDFIRTFPG